MKLLIVGWFHLINPIITAKEHFEILQYDVYFFPLLHYNRHFNEENLYNVMMSFIKI